MDIQEKIPNSKAKDLLIFWARMLGWILAKCGAPIGVFAVKFGLFKPNEPEVDSLGNVTEQPSIALNGWGIIACIIIGITLMSILKEVVAAFPSYSLAKQCFTGIVKTIIPLVMLYLICFFLNGVVSEIMFCLGTLIIFWGIAIPLNPLPKWKFEKKGSEDYGDALSFLVDYVKSKKKDQGGVK
jgi:hypothetical protein